MHSTHERLYLSSETSKVINVVTFILSVIHENGGNHFSSPRHDLTMDVQAIQNVPWMYRMYIKENVPPWMYRIYIKQNVPPWMYRK